MKNADLYKMHTYNEAIRRTVGSYVLYPGSDVRTDYQRHGDNRNVYRRYHEIIPGIGAFALKPKAGSDNVDVGGVECLRRFFYDFLVHQLSKFTQYYRCNYWTQSTIRRTTNRLTTAFGDFQFSAKPPQDTQILLGFVRDEQEIESMS